MKTRTIYLALMIVFQLSCTNNEIVVPETYECQPSFQDSSATHPKAHIYQEILDRNRRLGIIGASLLIKDEAGVWLGSSGKADIASQVDVNSCNRFMIASITKVFTAAAVYRYIDKGLLAMNDNVADFLSAEDVEKIENVATARIEHLLSHTSGIADYYTLQYQLDQINNVYNNWSQQRILKFAYGKPATHPVGQTYFYSNTNYLLLGMLLERVSGKSLEQVYQEELFDPLGLTSAYFGKGEPIPSDAVKGYADIYGNGRYVESEFLYKDELKTADGGIAANAYDVGIFLEKLMKGQLLSEESMAELTNWFELPEPWVYEELGHTQNGYGIEYFNTPYGYAVGHTGSIFGFYSLGFYFPETDRSFVLLTNSATYDNTPKTNIYHEVLTLMFED